VTATAGSDLADVTVQKDFWCWDCCYKQAKALLL